MLKNQFLKVKNSNDVKIKREIEEQFFKPNIKSIDDMDKFELTKIKKITPIKTIGMIGWLIIFLSLSEKV